MNADLDRHEAIVIGGGQAGLALGYPTRDEVVAYLTGYARDFELPWQHTRGSALLGWVTDDAQHIAEQISKLATARVDPLTATA